MHRHQTLFGDQASLQASSLVRGIHRVGIEIEGDRSKGAHRSDHGGDTDADGGLEA